MIVKQYHDENKILLLRNHENDLFKNYGNENQKQKWLPNNGKLLASLKFQLKSINFMFLDRFQVNKVGESIEVLSRIKTLK